MVTNDQLIETLQSLYDKHAGNNQSVGTATLASKTARRLLVLLFVQSCQSRLEQIERLIQLIPLVFRSHDHQVNRSFCLSVSVRKMFVLFKLRISSQRMERIQEKVVPYLQDLLQIYQVLLWLSSCGMEASNHANDDR